jgi:hypothetical protein
MVRNGNGRNTEVHFNESVKRINNTWHLTHVEGAPNFIVSSDKFQKQDSVNYMFQVMRKSDSY